MTFSDHRAMTEFAIPPFIASLPKAELHMHLEGSLEPETLMLFAARNGVRLPYPDAASLRQAYRFDSLHRFSISFISASPCCRPVWISTT